VREALCFGWIDSLIKRLDDDRSAIKITDHAAQANERACSLRAQASPRPDEKQVRTSFRRVPRRTGLNSSGAQPQRRGGSLAQPFAAVLLAELFPSDGHASSQ